MVQAAGWWRAARLADARQRGVLCAEAPRALVQLPGWARAAAKLLRLPTALALPLLLLCCWPPAAARSERRR